MSTPARPGVIVLAMSAMGMWFVRYGIGIVMVLAGLVVLAVNPAGTGVDGFAMAVGGGLAVLLLNFLYRLSVSDSDERARHEQDWRYFEEHGEWPEEPAPKTRRWTLPAGVVTAEAEEAEREAKRADGTVGTGGHL
jgi:hypothetical protein